MLKDMLSYLLTGIVCLILLFSTHTSFAEELPLPDGKNIKEWESISAALVAEKRFNEAIVYLDKILDEEPNNLKALSNKAGLLIQLEKYVESIELSDKVLKIEPNKISALTNKAIALKMLGEYEMSYQLLTKIVILDSENEAAKKSRAKLLSSMPTTNANNSEYMIHVLVVVRNSSGDLIATTESTNARYLESKFTESWWIKMVEKDRIQINNNVEIYQDNQILKPEDDHTGLFSLQRIMDGYTINIFEVFTPMIQLEESDTLDVQWTIIKN
tara:strand:- start:1184 stop:1999 length:816 start_codon:yes stop_codon:yes gene_type:complete